MSKPRKTPQREHLEWMNSIADMDNFQKENYGTNPVVTNLTDHGIELDSIQEENKVMKVKYIAEVDAEETNTEGTNTYLVALECGGIMEDPEVHYHNYQIIRADSENEAVEKYNKINKCNYFYGHVMGLLDSEVEL